MIRIIIRNGGISMRQESKTTEFKREYTDDLKYAVVAFANTDGGKIYIGINDDGSVHISVNYQVTNSGVQFGWKANQVDLFAYV